MPYAKGNSKVCSACRVEKPVTEFYRDKTFKDGRQNQCRVCKAKSNKKWRDKNAAKMRSYAAEWHRLKRYGITHEEFTARVEACGNCCEICRKPQNPAFRVLDIDHDHVTGQVRGLLCRDCNIALRCEDPVILRAMADYLEKYRE